DLSGLVPTAFSSGCQKLGQPVRLSNLVADENRSRLQPAQAKLPERFSFRSGLVYGRSVALSRSTAYWSAVRSLRHSTSLRVSSNVSAPNATPRNRALEVTARPVAPPASRKSRFVSMTEVRSRHWLRVISTGI